LAWRQTRERSSLNPSGANSTPPWDRGCKVGRSDSRILRKHGDVRFVRSVWDAHVD